MVEIEYRIFQKSGKIIGLKEKKWVVKDKFGNPIRLDGATRIEKESETVCDECDDNLLQFNYS